MDASRLLETFFDLVKTDCPSGHEAAAARYCADVLEEIGCDVTIDDAGTRTGSDAGNVFAVLPGSMDGTVIMTAHLDCVQPCESVDPRIVDGIIVSDGTTVLGGDDKVGVASILEAVRCLAEDGEPHRTVKVVFSIQEEVGCLGAKELDPTLLGEGEPCYVFDGDGEVGAACLAAPYHYVFEARFTGKASHAGVAPEKGVSAIVAASRAIDMMRERGLLGAVGEYCASNIGRIEGGGATNVVPEACTITGECRAIDKDAVERVHAGMDACMREGAQECGAAVEVDWTLEYPGYLLSDDAPAVQLFNRAVEAVGLQPSVYKSAGGTDANIYASSGVDPLVVSTGMADFHSVSEHLAVADLENTARIAIALARV